MSEMIATRRRTPTHHVTSKRVRDAEGQVRTIQVVDADSPTLTEDLQLVFDRNIARARAENKRLLGRPDGVVRRK